MIEMSREANMEAEAPLNHQGGGCDGRGIDPITDIRYREFTFEVFIQSSIERVLISPCTKVLAVSGMSSPSRNSVSSGPDNDKITFTCSMNCR